MERLFDCKYIGANWSSNGGKLWRKNSKSFESDDGVRNAPDSLDVPLVLVPLPSSLVSEEDGNLMNENGVFAQAAHCLKNLGDQTVGKLTVSRVNEGRKRSSSLFCSWNKSTHGSFGEGTKASAPHSQFFLVSSIRCRHPPNLIMCNSFQICVLLFLHLLLLPCSFFLKREQFLSE